MKQNMGMDISLYSVGLKCLYYNYFWKLLKGSSYIKTKKWISEHAQWFPVELGILSLCFVVKSDARDYQMFRVEKRSIITCVLLRENVLHETLLFLYWSLRMANFQWYRQGN